MGPNSPHILSGHHQFFAGELGAISGSFSITRYYYTFCIVTPKPSKKTSWSLQELYFKEDNVLLILTQLYQVSLYSFRHQHFTSSIGNKNAKEMTNSTCLCLYVQGFVLFWFWFLVLNSNPVFTLSMHVTWHKPSPEQSHLMSMLYSYSCLILFTTSFWEQGTILIIFFKMP